ncbi:very short patch repair endonuclease [Myxococcus stipitatus]|uniref:very short patch repair endonuclease n=1 Tax=Myxococcus stipitatus TaxID=83455 RepID=UPI0030D45458
MPTPKTFQRKGKTSPRRQSPKTITPTHVLAVDPRDSARLGGIRQSNTNIERQTQLILHSLGLRFRTKNRSLPGSPDLANHQERWAIFVHGCYWHSHQGCPRATIPKRNRDFWLAKFEANRARDARALRSLRRCGYRAVVVWECQLHSAPERVRKRLARLLLEQRIRVSDEVSTDLH